MGGAITTSFVASLLLHISTHPQSAGKLKLGGGGEVNFVASLLLRISTHPQPPGKLKLRRGGGGKLISWRLYYCA